MRSSVTRWAHSPCASLLTDSAGIRITTVTGETVRALEEWRLAEAPDHVLSAGATGDSTAFALIGAVHWLRNGMLVVADLSGARLHVFDSTGAYQKSLGGRGQGPGELGSIASITPMRGDTLAVSKSNSIASRRHDCTTKPSLSFSERMPAARAQSRLAMSFDPVTFPERRPSIGRVLTDDEGRLWVERFEPTRLGAQLQVPGNWWTVLAVDGRPIARLQLPPRTRLEAVRGDRVAVVQWDELDVQSAAIHELQR